MTCMDNGMQATNMHRKAAQEETVCEATVMSWSLIKVFRSLLTKMNQ